MGMHTTKVAVGEGKFTLEAQLTVTPRGMVVYACSPEFAHPVSYTHLTLPTIRLV